MTDTKFPFTKIHSFKATKVKGFSEQTIRHYKAQPSGAAVGIEIVDSKVPSNLPLDMLWNEERYVVSFQADTHYEGGVIINQIMRGYSGAADYTLENSFFVLDSASVTYNYPGEPAMHGHYLMMTGKSNEHKSERQVTHLLRPYDVLTVLDGIDVMGEDTHYLDMRTTLTKYPRIAYLHNNVLFDYIKSAAALLKETNGDPALARKLIKQPERPSATIPFMDFFVNEFGTSLEFDINRLTSIDPDAMNDAIIQYGTAEPAGFFDDVSLSPAEKHLGMVVGVSVYSEMIDTGLAKKSVFISWGGGHNYYCHESKLPIALPNFGKSASSALMDSALEEIHNIEVIRHEGRMEVVLNYLDETKPKKVVHVPVYAMQQVSFLTFSDYSEMVEIAKRFGEPYLNQA